MKLHRQKQIGIPPDRAGEESDPDKDFFSVLFAYPAAWPTGMRSQGFSERFLMVNHFPQLDFTGISFKERLL